MKRKEQEVTGDTEDQIKSLRSQVRTLRRCYYITWACFTLTTINYIAQYTQVYSNQQEIKGSIKENQAAFEKLGAAIQEFLEMTQ